MEPPLSLTETQRWQRAKEIFAAAVGLDPEPREEFLAEALGEDQELAAQVRSLLREDALSEGVLDEMVFDLGLHLVSTQHEPQAEGRILGRYRLLHKIGHGGMGEVYAAERADGQFDQRVAIKLVREGLDSSEVVQRFDVERRILGRLDHPHIAQIFDGGVSPEGRPYLVMEYVEGVPIDEYCESQGLSIDARLQLFRRVASAVQYAHQNLVVHRDLKPSNLLVTQEGIPKLLDFGIARLLAPTETPSAPTLTQPWQRRLTPAYASPEQILGRAITTASDVYSLGVVLYEVLTDRPLYRFPNNPPREIEKTVCEEIPPKPSTVVAPRLRRRLRGDLDNIVLKALRKEPERRYASADRLSEDLRRHLEELPVLARKDTLAYRLTKLLRRHKVAAAFLLLLSGFGLAVVSQSIRLNESFEKTKEALQTAQIERQKAEEVLNFLIGILEVADPRGENHEAVTVLQVLQEGAVRLRKELAEQPEAQATLMDTIGKVYLQLGQLEDAELFLEESLVTRRNLLPDGHPDVATSFHNLGRLRRETGEWQAAEALTRKALELRRARFGEDHTQVAESLNSLGLVLYNLGDYPRAEPVLMEALEIRKQLLARPHRLISESLNNLGLLYFRMGNLDAADRLLREAAKGYERSLGDDHPDLIAALQNLTMVIHRQGAPEEAEEVLRRVLVLQKQRLGPGHRDVADTLKNLGALIARRKDYEESEALLREALAIHRKVLGNEHPDVAKDFNDLGALLQAKGDLKAAEPLLVQALALRRKVLPEGHLSLASSLVSLGSLHLDADSPSLAEPFLREGLEIRRQNLPDGHWRIAVAENVLGGALARLNRRQEAMALLVGTYPIIEQRLGADHRITRRAQRRLAQVCAGFNEPEAPCRDLGTLIEGD